ncbi:MAG TPA: hypothetical protein VGO40_02025 [Longimicrobium sp.]|jgi:hypothetical protein|nr:hypothetical protein [Longimicrobium sp.]
MLAQSAALVWLAGAGAAAGAVMAVAAVACGFAWERRGRVPHADFVVAACAFGGLGMAMADAFASPAAHAGAGMAHAHAEFVSWPIPAAAMLAVCVPACLWTCAPLCGGGPLRRSLAHGAVALGMLGGMAAAGVVLAPALAPMVGAVGGMHVAMVLGMAAGTAAVLPLTPLLDRRAGRIAHPHPSEAAWPA